MVVEHRTALLSHGLWFPEWAQREVNGTCSQGPCLFLPHLPLWPGPTLSQSVLTSIFFKLFYNVQFNQISQLSKETVQGSLGPYRPEFLQQWDISWMWTLLGSGVHKGQAG